MSWQFDTDPEFQKTLDWIDDFVTSEIEPVDRVITHAWDMSDPLRQKLIPPLQQIVKERGLWATHLTPELGGAGFGQMQLSLINEILGRTHSGPIVFGTQAPDSGNSEILAHFGTPELKKRYLEPLIANEIVSCFTMTEPQGGSNPTEFTTTAKLVGDEWVINGEKWFASNQRFADFFIIMAVTDPDAAPHRRLSMFVVPKDAPGITIVRNTGVWGHDYAEGTHAYARWEDVRVPSDHILGGVGDGFHVAQTRLGGGRVHHAMRTVGKATKALEMSLERAASRQTRGGRLGDQQFVQGMLADSWIELEQFRLLVLRTAWRIDKENDYKKVIKDIAAVKIALPKVLHDITSRAIQIHGSLGVSKELVLGKWLMESYHHALADGATEVHKVGLARQLMRNVEPWNEQFPSYHLPRLREEAEAKFARELSEVRAATSLEQE
ncbi:acyl-CoA dehydrogenase family protein [Rhodococcus pseudokoreensis]|uniref:Acyl-CoA dehydrogenase family protein n=1 Tax=Rhodococcus pseudokoreensis TaxID=2811421 RepID=A0A974W3Y0_9NOCA|nr:acyl-CoA dehydrogenase family protein [Rhodococcus pseudokoreensis]QSE90794.1 acyl-CoA dehydrogenase family protein [Rhodococcus pseudokoreensis]